jgi:hypothetical protein
VIVNDLKALGEKINDDDVSSAFDVLTSKIWDVEIAHHKRRIEGTYP